MKVFDGGVVGSSSLYNTQQKSVTVALGPSVCATKH